VRAEHPAERAQHGCRHGLSRGHHAPASLGLGEGRLAVESELAHDTSRERAALEELHLVLEELHPLEVTRRRDHLRNVGHLWGLSLYVQHCLGGPATRRDQTHHRHHGEARRGAPGDEAPAPSHHGEHLSQLGIARA
jgi:hypothetical protein